MDANCSVPSVSTKTGGEYKKKSHKLETPLSQQLLAKTTGKLPEYWTCNYCTYTNTKDSLKCGICDVEKPKKNSHKLLDTPTSQQPAQATDSLSPEYWTCNYCTYINTKDTLTCGICGVLEKTKKNSQKPISQQLAQATDDLPEY